MAALPPTFPRFVDTLLSATSQVRRLKVVLDGQTLYIEKPLAQALGRNPGTSTEGVSLRLSDLDPKFFTITPADIDVGMHPVPVVERAGLGALV